ncbi:MAG: M56 family metallopeptidase [Clostridia bacterium]|nr:M56 family metallopeptidase [Clostridia bacterium]
MADFICNFLRDMRDLSFSGDLLLKFFNMSVTAAWLILAVLLLRLLFKKAPKWLRVALWGVVGLRLLLPFSLPSRVSLVPSTETVSSSILDGPALSFTLNTGFPAVDAPLNRSVTECFTTPIADYAGWGFDLMVFLSFLWFAGIAAMLIWALASYLRLRYQVRASVKEDKNVYLCDGLKSPFILGVLRPRICLPSGLAGRQKDLILSHERAHLARRDHLWKPLGFLLLSVYWFNPFIWLAYILLCRDIELACDERVTKTLSESEKADYSQALLDCAFKRRAVTACPVAFGEVGVKQRVKNVLNYKKPAFWIILVAVIASVVCAVCFLTDPLETNGAKRFYGIDPTPGTLLNKALPEMERMIETELEKQHRYGYSGEFVAAGISVFGSEETDTQAKVYFHYEISAFGFDNGFFTDTGGASASAAAVFEIGGNSFALKEIQHTRDGADLAPSIKKIFPAALVKRASDATQKDRDEMRDICERKARQYLESIGRADAEIRPWGEVPHTLLTDLGVSVEVTNNLRIADVMEAGYVGVWEAVENGARYVYENGYEKEKNLLTFKKYVFNTGEVVFDLGLDASTGEVVYGASMPDNREDQPSDGSLEPTVYGEMIVPETAEAIPDTSRQAAVTPDEVSDRLSASLPGGETQPYVSVPYTTNAGGTAADDRVWTTVAAPANGRDTAFSEATEEDFKDLGTEFGSGYFLDLLDVTFLRKSAPRSYTADYDAATVTDAQLRDLLFYASHSFICDRYLGEPETVQFGEKDDPFPALKNETHRYVKYDKANIDWTATYILNAKAPEPGRFLDGASFAGYKDGYYYFVDELFGVEDDFTARAAKITRQPDGTYSVEIEYRDVFTEELLNGGGTAILGLRDMGGQKIWSVLSYQAEIKA